MNIPSLQDFTEAPSYLVENVNQQLKLNTSKVYDLDFSLEIGATGNVDFPIGNQVLRVDFKPHSIRSTNYQIKVQTDSGWESVPAGPIQTIRGTVLDHPEYHVAGSIKEDGLYATFFCEDDTRCSVQPSPIQDRNGYTGTYYVIYDHSDMMESNNTCEMLHIEGETGETGCGCGETGENRVMNRSGTFYCAELACDADVEYYQAFGSSVSNVEAEINSIINTVNIQYETQTNITHVLSTILVRTSEPDPYTSTNAVTLLNQFKNEWDNNQGAIQRDVAHLFTGKNIDGGTIGIAWVGAVCTTFAYGLSQNFSPFSCMTDLTAHELGHNWNAPHCDPCSTTMRSFLGCFNTFGQNTINTITAFRDTRTCIEEPLPNVGFDPWVEFDPTAGTNGRFFTMAIGFDGSSTTSFWLYINVSKTSSPNVLNNTDWWRYKINVARPFTGGGSITHMGMDYEKAGFTKDHFWVGGNQFGLIAGGFSGFQGFNIFVFDKSDLINGVGDGGAPTIVAEYSNNPNRTGGGFFSFTPTFDGSLMPAAVYADNSTGVVDHSWWITEWANSTVRLYRFHPTNGTFETTLIVVSAMALLGASDVGDQPPPCPSNVETISSRFMSAVVRNDEFYASHTVVPSGESRQLVQWYHFDISNWPSSPPSVSIIEQGFLDPGPGWDCWMSHMEVDEDRNIGISFTMGGQGTNPAQYLSIGYTGKPVSDPLNTMRPVQIARIGDEGYQLMFSGSRNRWGDYSGLSVDPDGSATNDERRFWIFHEYPHTSGTCPVAGGGGSCNECGIWTTWMGAFSPQVRTLPSLPLGSSTIGGFVNDPRGEPVETTNEVGQLNEMPSKEYVCIGPPE